MAFALQWLGSSLRAGDFIQLTSRTVTARQVECRLTGEVGPSRTTQEGKSVASL